MNPTDQARKEARKQELKKNKKQRQLVRAAVLKGKDPHQLIEELEKIDQMEYNVAQPSPLNEKVLKDKRKKLRETLERVLSMYGKDDPDKYNDLKRRQMDYEHKRNQIVSFYESVKHAQQVTVDEIPLPQLPQQPAPPPSLQIPLPSEIKKQEHTIYSIATALKLQALGQPIMDPPGCPPGPPPEIDSDGEVVERIQDQSDANLSDEYDSEEEHADEEISKPTSLQQKMVAISGQNVDDFMKEMEQVTQKKLDESKIPDAPISVLPPSVIPDAAVMPNIKSLIGPPPTIFPMRVPPGPPPGRPLMPPGPPPGLPPPRMPIRMGGMGGGPRMLRIPGPPPNMPHSGMIPNPNVLSAGPQLVHRSDNPAAKQGATISAKPQIRNLSADVTRFVPSTLRVKRDDKKPMPTRRALLHEVKQKDLMIKQNHPPINQVTKDDAYMQFMREMQGLL